MAEHTVSASEVRDRFADYLEMADKRRVLVQKHGRDRAYLVSVRELRALEETIAVLENNTLLNGIVAGLKDVEEDRVRDADEVFTELDREFGEET